MSDIIFEHSTGVFTIKIKQFKYNRIVSNLWYIFYLINNNNVFLISHFYFIHICIILIGWSIKNKNSRIKYYKLRL